MELRHVLSILRKRAPLLVLAAILGGVLGWLVTPNDPQYVARSTIYVGSRLIETEGNSELNEARNRAIDRFVLTFATMIDTESVARQALERTGLDRPAERVVDATETRPVPLTQLLYIDVTDEDPAVAQALADGLAEAFVDSVQEFEPGEGAGGEGQLPVLPAYIFESAKLPTTPQPDGLLRNVALFALLGLAGAVALSLTAAYLDLSVRSPDDVERRIELPVLAAIPQLASLDAGALPGRH